MNIERWPWDLAGPDPDAVEIGSTWLAPSAQRTPINTEAKLLMLTHAFEVWKVLRVTLEDRRAQRAVAQRASSGSAPSSTACSARTCLRTTARGPATRPSTASLPSEWPAVRSGLRIRLGIPDDPGGAH